MPKVIVFILAILNVSCGGWVSDSIDKLPGGYIHVFESKTQRIIQGNAGVIPCSVLDYNYNNDFILVTQEPIHMCICYASGYKKDIDSVDVFQFWIIDIKGDSLYGPLRMSDYLRMRDSLQVPDNLRLKLKL